MVARELGIEAGTERLAGILTPDMLLGLGAFLVTNLWLDAALKAAQGTDRPELLDTDGDPLEFTTLHFPLRPGIAAQKLRAAGLRKARHRGLAKIDWHCTFAMAAYNLVR